MSPRILAFAVTVALASAASASPGIPAAASKIAVTEHVGDPLPLDLPFMTSAGARIRLRDAVVPGRPTLLVLAYARCAMLCSTVLRGVAEVARALPLEPGRDYNLVLVGLDPHETPDEAARKQAGLLEDLGRGPDRAKWPYLVGTEANVATLAGALGFGYAWDPISEQYAHPAVIFAIGADGRIARYLHGAQFSSGEVLDALAGAAGTGTASAAAILRCFRFDPAHAARRAQAQRVIRIGAGVVFGLLASSVIGLLIWERRRGR